MLCYQMPSLRFALRLQVYLIQKGINSMKHVIYQAYFSINTIK